MSIDKEIVEDFVSESKGLLEELLETLERIEGDFSNVKKLADYGNGVDRIMGGAQSLALLAPPDHALNLIADYAAVCKAVGYKGSQISDNEKFFDICVAFLLDATETMQTQLDSIHLSMDVLKESVPPAFIDRLRWISKKFDENVSMSVGTGEADDKLEQNEIDQLLKKLGL